MNEEWKQSFVAKTYILNLLLREKCILNILGAIEASLTEIYLIYI